MDYSKVEKFIKENADAEDFTGGINKEIISELEDKLQLNFPKSYKWFLQNYGSGGMYGIEILGFVNGKATVVEHTEDYRRHFNLPRGIAVIEYIDEFSYCLDTNKMIDGECPVILWANEAGYGRTVAENFLNFFFERLKEKKENWEEEDWDDEE
ncbi:SMI1/KNR4 family protein [Bacillus swezeyi]|uniref:SMI1/KNR4 family protein n=1 Tax=Bacillus swezeyi TaxID=1925020 RepID=UPI003F8A21A3